MLTIPEEQLKVKIHDLYFPKSKFEIEIIGKIDFAVVQKSSHKPCLWAEAKKGKADYIESLTQLIITIGKARTFDKFTPPTYLGAFDGEKIAFLPYYKVQAIFYMNDFNWNVTPSNHETKEFKEINTLLNNYYLKLEHPTVFHYATDAVELKNFIAGEFISDNSGNTKLQIDKNNFISIYNKWHNEVKNSISVNWDIAKKNKIIDADFYLADLLSEENKTLKEKLYVLLKSDHYELDRRIDADGMFASRAATFLDGQRAHTNFWAKYQRPPKEEYWDYIIERRDLLVPQDVRERKGSFFTPQCWVELSQKYLANTLGENWQDEYYIWDCAAGTGNLLAGLSNKYNIWASTLDMQDVNVMYDRIQHGANLLDTHVFQFDFLNDDFSKLPLELQKIIKDEKKRKKLVIYINPPYAEATSATTVTGTGANKSGVALNNRTYEKYKAKIGKASNELFTQFFARISGEMRGVILAEFSTLKILQAPNFGDFRKFFNATLQKMFVVPANTFDNVKGDFPIGFFIWNTECSHELNCRDVACRVSTSQADVYDKDAKIIEQKSIYICKSDTKYINSWIALYKTTNNKIAELVFRGNDFQHNKYTCLVDNDYITSNTKFAISQDNLNKCCIYFSVRQCIPATWLNDRDQFLYPNDGWQTDTEFQNDCLAYTLFHGQNRISSEEGTNYWIPFTEQEVDAKEKFESHFMSSFLAGKYQTSAKSGGQSNLFAKVNTEKTKSLPLEFSPEAQAVFGAGRELWHYYHAQPNANPNASFYDIRAYFQGRTGGRMNNKSTDEKYNNLLAELRSALDTLAKQIETGVYLYGFLK